MRTVRIIRIPKYKKAKYIIKDVSTGQNYYSMIESQSEALRLVDDNGWILQSDYVPQLWIGEQELDIYYGRAEQEMGK